MSAVAALRAARAAGVRVRVDGADLMLEAPAPPPSRVLDALLHHKAELVALLERFQGRAVPLLAPTGVPDAWIQGVDELIAAESVAGFDLDRWNEVVDDAYLLLRDYGAVAAFFGWNTLDLFGCDPDDPDGHVDRKGLALLMRGGEIVSLDHIRAYIRMPSGSLLTHLRYAYRGSVPLWKIVADDATARAASEAGRRSWTVAEAIEHARRLMAARRPRTPLETTEPAERSE